MPYSCLKFLLCRTITYVKSKFKYFKCNFWLYIAEFLLERGKFQIKLLGKVKPVYCFNNFFSENHRVFQTMWKNVPESNKSLLKI